jgi:hypothetical protein
MQDRKVTLLIEEDGSVAVEVDGVKGKACTELTAEMEQALGMVTSQDKKAAYHVVGSKEAAHQQLRG